MVAHPGASDGALALRPVNAPQPLEARPGPGGLPRCVRVRGRWVSVARVLDGWRIDDEWWRPDPVSRLYLRLLLADGTTVLAFQDLGAGGWFAQRA